MATADSTLTKALSAFRRGDPDAEELLLAHCHAWLARLAAKRILPGYPDVARWDRPSDLAQEATLRLHLALRERAPESERHLLNLAAMKLRQVVIDRVRHYRAQRNPLAQAGTNVGAGDDGQELRVENLPGSFTSALTYDQWNQFFTAVDSLPEPEREVFHMTWFLGADQAAISRACNCSLETVKRRWKQAKEKLKVLVPDPPRS